MTKIFIPPEQFDTDSALIKGEDAHHVIVVLRKRIGDQLLIGVNNKTYLAQIHSIQEHQVIVTITNQVEINYESPVYTRLYQGLAKGNKMELVIEKAVELGVNEVIPFTSRYTVVKLTDEKKQSRQLRWQRVANEAAKQCKRDIIPQIHTTITFQEVMQKLACQPQEHLRLLAYEQATDKGLWTFSKEEPKEISVIVGAEGGFCEQEVNDFAAIGGKIITLGNRILRTETAGIACLAMIQLLWGDLR